MGQNPGVQPAAVDKAGLRLPAHLDGALHRVPSGVAERAGLPVQPLQALLPRQAGAGPDGGAGGGPGLAEEQLFALSPPPVQLLPDLLHQFYTKQPHKSNRNPSTWYSSAQYSTESRMYRAHMLRSEAMSLPQPEPLEGPPSSHWR